MKRFLEVISGFVFFIVVSPVLLLSMMFLVFLDRQNPFFIQSRVGKNKQPFSIIKLRTMKRGMPTLVGKVLRKTGIDELPQLMNIIAGQMSFVGPRPLTEEDIFRLGWNTDFYSSRWSVRPGLVGLAQLSPVCNKKMSWFLDHTYIKQQCFALDFRIVSAAALIPVLGKPRVQNWIYRR